MAPPKGNDSRVLVVDDNPFVSSLLEHALAAEGYRVTVAADGREALARVADDPPAPPPPLEPALAPEGPRVTGAAAGREPPPRVADAPPPLLLPALALPSPTGAEICRPPKTAPATRLIPVVMVTAMSAFQNKL